VLTDKPLTEMDNFPHQNLILYKVEYDGSKFNIIDFNDAAHLKSLK